MTNAEKYKEVFGMNPDKSSCPTKLCKNCPVNDYKDEPCRAGYSYHWWNSEYIEEKTCGSCKEKCDFYYETIKQGNIPFGCLLNRGDNNANND